VAGVKSGEVSKSVLAVLARLGRFARIGRAAEAAAEAARLERTLVALSAMAGFTEEARAARLVEHLADRELASLARIAERAKLAEGAGADALRVAVRADRVLAKETDDLTSALQLLGHFEDKLGGTIGPEAAAGIRHMLENSSWSWERRLRLADRVPAENAEEFLRALRKVEPRQFRSWGSAVFEGIAERPKGIRFLGEVGGEIYESAFNRTGASWPSFERFIDGVAIRKAELDNPAEYQKLLDRLARHDATAFEDVLGARLRSITARGPSAESEKLLAAAVGDTGDAVRRLTPEARRAARIAADASPELVDRAVKAETELFERTLGELDASLTNAGMPKEDVEKTLQAVRDLNREHNQLRGQQQIREMILRVEKLADPFPLRWSVEERIDHFRSRARSLREANPRRAGELDAEARRLEKLRTPGGPLYDAEALQREVKKSVYLMRGVQGGEEELRRLWVQYWTRRKEPKSGFAQYAERIYRSHHVGMVGEYEVAFRKGEQLILLKAPDGMVTIGGTDMVAIERATGNVLLIDNKALSAGQVDKVDALVRNLRGNVKSDLQTFAAASRDGKLPSQVDGAISRLRDASNEIEAKYGRMSRKEFEANTTVQKDVTDILRRHGVRRVVTNAGGEVSGLSQELADIGFELDDLNL